MYVSGNDTVIVCMHNQSVHPVDREIRENPPPKLYKSRSEFVRYIFCFFVHDPCEYRLTSCFLGVF
jgi:hypothetical protein